LFVERGEARVLVFDDRVLLLERIVGLGEALL